MLNEDILKVNKQIKLCELKILNGTSYFHTFYEVLLFNPKNTVRILNPNKVRSGSACL